MERKVSYHASGITAEPNKWNECMAATAYKQRQARQRSTRDKTRRQHDGDSQDSDEERWDQNLRNLTDEEVSDGEEVLDMLENENETTLSMWLSNDEPKLFVLYDGSHFIDYEGEIIPQDIKKM